VESFPRQALCRVFYFGPERRSQALLNRIRFLHAMNPGCALLRVSRATRETGLHRRSVGRSPAVLCLHAGVRSEMLSTVSPVCLEIAESEYDLCLRPSPLESAGSRKRVCNSRRIRTSKTQDLKPFRIRIYEKAGRGVRWGVVRTGHIFDRIDRGHP
jgi:hypothetical protein